jgi:hypothetical protein
MSILGNLNINITAELGRDALEKMVREYVEANSPGYTVKKVHWDVSQQHDMRGEPMGATLTKVRIELGPKSPKNEWVGQER